MLKDCLGGKRKELELAFSNRQTVLCRQSLSYCNVALPNWIPQGNYIIALEEHWVILRRCQLGVTVCRASGHCVLMVHIQY